MYVLFYNSSCLFVKTTHTGVTDLHKLKKAGLNKQSLRKYFVRKWRPGRIIEFIRTDVKESSGR